MSVNTIVAAATPPGQGGVAVVRISGPAVRAIALAMLAVLPAPRHAMYCIFRDADGKPIDQGIALFFPAPHSFTGEDVLELQGHGSPAVIDLLLERLVELGARLARPGEFSERAFLNGKMDLVQAEAIADLISAGSAAAARSALRSLQGEFSHRVHQITERLIQLRMYVEASIDFPEEEIDFLADPRIMTEIETLKTMMHELLSAATQGCLLQTGMTIALTGAPNAGKSSLLNALTQSDAAIVSHIPGTTRDVIRERINLDGMPLHLLDTAGLRESNDEIETEGVRRTHAAIACADRILVVLDDTASEQDQRALLAAHIRPETPHTLVYNKIDLSGRPPGQQNQTQPPTISLSAKTGSGLEALRLHLRECMGFQPAGEGAFIARRRHIDAIQRALIHLAQAQTQLGDQHAGELLAEELRLTQQTLSEITGEFTSEDLLGRVFSNFCIGK